MAKQTVAIRLTPDEAAWIDGYAAERGMSRQVWIESAIANFREDCERGVPDFVARARSQAGNDVADADSGVGVCPERPSGLGHVWRAASEDPVRPCRFCGLAGRAMRGGARDEDVPANFLDVASAERAELFAKLSAPMTSGARPGADRDRVRRS